MVLGDPWQIVIRPIGVNLYWPNGLGPPPQISSAWALAWPSPPFFGMKTKICTVIFTNSYHFNSTPWL
jgi:hypothetical protein